MGQRSVRSTPNGLTVERIPIISQIGMSPSEKTKLMMDLAEELGYEVAKKDKVQ